MGFFASGGVKTPARKGGEPSLKLLHQMGCRLCPLDNAPVKHPKMEPTGSKRPLVYMLGEAPGEDEDYTGRQFVGRAGKVLRARVPEEWDEAVRWNNVIRTRPPKNRTPENIEIECCRKYVEGDIEHTKPRAIFGFGNIPLLWALKRHRIGLWRGRRIPIRVGSHACWFYPMLHPSYINRVKKDGKRPDQIGSEDERMFVLDLERAFAEVEHLPEPIIHTREDAEEGVYWVTGDKDGDYQTVIEFLRWAATQRVVGVDYETHGLDGKGKINGLRPYRKDAAILTIAVGTPEMTLSFPLDHPKAGWRPDELEGVRAAWSEFLQAPKVIKAVHQLAFEMEWTTIVFGRDKLRSGQWGDSLSQAFVLDERQEKAMTEGPLSLGWLTLQYFGLSIKSLSTVNRKVIINEPLKDVLRYNGIDGKYHCLLYLAQERLIAARGLEDVYKAHLRRVPTCVLTQIKGVPISQTVVRKLQDKYADRIEKTEREMREMEIVRKFKTKYGYEFNPGSIQKDVIFLFRDMLKEKAGFKDRHDPNKYAVDEDVLSKIEHPLAKLLVDWRKVTKLKSTYCDGLAEGSEYLYPDGMLHPILNTTTARTGRLSSEEPNEQNFPKRDAEGKEARSQIVARKGHLLLAADYGQIEARVIAMASRDKVLTKALWERYDIHGEWARRIALEYPKRVGGKKGIDDPKVMKLFRDDVKNQWTFPAFFGAQLAGISGYLEIPEDVLSPLFDEFWGMFDGVKEWQDRLVAKYRETGEVCCLTGRKRRGPLSINQIINTPVQGTAADIVLDSMDRLSEREDWVLQPNMQIHDDLTWEIEAKNIEQYAEIMIDEMLNVPFDFVNVPITIEMSVGPHWYDMKETGKYSSDEWFK